MAHPTETVRKEREAVLQAFKEFEKWMFAPGSHTQDEAQREIHKLRACAYFAIVRVATAHQYEQEVRACEPTS